MFFLIAEVNGVFLVGGFNPFEKYWSKWESPPNRGEHKTYLSCHHLVWGGEKMTSSPEKYGGVFGCRLFRKCLPSKIWRFGVTKSLSFQVDPTNFLDD